MQRLKSINRINESAKGKQNSLREGIVSRAVPDACTVIFGATGDLTHRKLIPALYNIAAEAAPHALSRRSGAGEKAAGIGSASQSRRFTSESRLAA
ncbi:hypothetical protein BH20VER1_BH20VER1_09130 [soil metagenome]